MKPEEFKQCANEMISYIVDYSENIRSRTVLPSVAPGYLANLVPAEPPEKPEHWTTLLPDVERCIMPGLTHWHSPNFNAFYTLGNSYPSVLGEMMAAGLGTIAMNWASNPVISELEVVVTDWLAKMMDLPKCFLASSPGPGGGVMQASGSEGILLSFLTAKRETIRRELKKHDDMDERMIKSKLVAYSSDQSNSSIEKNGRLADVIIRLLPSDDRGRLDPELLKAAVEEDEAEGLIPFFVVATLGTTSNCAFDQLDKIGPICEQHNIWLHVDGAYAAAAFICPEMRQYMTGLEHANSFNMNPHKWLLVHWQLSILWMKDLQTLVDCLSVDRTYLKDHMEEVCKYMLDFKNLEVSLGHPFRSLRMWFTIKMYGVEGMRSHIRKHLSLARRFESHVREDPRFQVVYSEMGLVCFRLKGHNDLTKELLLILLRERKVFMVGGSHRDLYFLRYCLGSRYTEESDVDLSWAIIKVAANQVSTDPQPDLTKRMSFISLSGKESTNLRRLSIDTRPHGN